MARAANKWCDRVRAEPNNVLAYRGLMRDLVHCLIPRAGYRRLSVQEMDIILYDLSDIQTDSPECEAHKHAIFDALYAASAELRDIEEKRYEAYIHRLCGEWNDKNADYGLLSPSEWRIVNRYNLLRW